MTAPDFRLVSELFEAAYELEPEDRCAYLASACGEDESLRAEVQSLLDHHDDPGAEGLETSPAPVQVDMVESGRPEEIVGYRIEGVLGTGGMGVVYRARQERPRRVVALKVVRRMADDAVNRRFEVESEALALLKHPGIAQIHAAGSTELDVGECPWIAMELVDGPDLARYAAERDLSEREILTLVADIADAVHYAHQQGVIHRDLKPANILIERDGDRPKVLDFGVARLTRSDVQSMTAAGNVVGTLTYMSPEQARGSSKLVDPRSDVYSLGVILYELLAGRLPVDLGEVDVIEALRRIRDFDPPTLGCLDPRLEGDVSVIVAKAMAKDAGRRYSSAADMAEDIRRHLRDEPITARPAGRIYVLAKLVRRHRGLVAGLAMTFLAVVVGLVVSIMFALRAQRNEDAALASQATSDRRLYLMGLQVAAHGLETGDFRRARANLDLTPVEDRNWEWHHLDSQITFALGDPEVVASLAFRSGDRPLALMVRDREACLVDVETGETLRVVGGWRSRRYRDIGQDLRGYWSTGQLSRDGSRVALEAGDRTHSTLHDIDFGGETPTVSSSVARVPSGALSPDGTLIWSNGRFSESGHFSPVARWAEDTGTATHGALFETDTGRVRLRRDGPASGEFSHDGTLLLIEPFEHSLPLEMLETVSGRIVARAQDPRAVRRYRNTWSPDGKFVAVAVVFERRTDVGRARHHGVDVHASETLERVCRLDAGKHPDQYVYGRGLTFLDNERLATAERERETRVLDLASGQVRQTVRSIGPPEKLVANPDGSMLGMVGRGFVQIEYPGRDAVLELRGHRSFVYCASFSPDGSVIASAAWDHTVRLWDSVTGEPVAELPTGGTSVSVILNYAYPRSLFFSSDGERLTAWAGGMRVWDLASGERRDDDRPEAEYLAGMPGGAGRHIIDHYERLAYRSPDGSLTFVGQIDGSIEVEHRDSGVRGFEMHSCKVKALAISDDGRVGASGGVSDLAVKLWDPATGKEIATLRGHTGPIYALAFNPDGTRLASGGRDGLVRIWDTATHELVMELTGHEDYVHDLDFSPDGTRLVSASGDHTLRVWDTVRPAVRIREARAAAALREKMAPVVDERLGRLGSPEAVAGSIRSDATFDAPSKRAALRVLLELSLR